MNDDQLAESLTTAMRTVTADDRASTELLQSLGRLRPRAPRPRALVPLMAAATVTAVVGAGAVAVTQASHRAGRAAPVGAATPGVRPTASAAPAQDDRAVLATAQWWTVTAVGGNPATPGTGVDTWSYARSGGIVQVRSTGNIRRPSPFWVGNHHATWQTLQSLPTTATGLRAMFGHIPHRSVASAMATTIGDLAQAPVPLDARRAIEAVATELPGAVVTHGTTDSTGRAAVHVLVPDADYRGVVDEYFFDPTSARLLEMDVHPTSGYTSDGAEPSSRQSFRNWSTNPPKVNPKSLPVVPWVTPFVP